MVRENGTKKCKVLNTLGAWFRFSFAFTFSDNALKLKKQLISGKKKDFFKVDLSTKSRFQSKIPKIA